MTVFESYRDLITDFSSFKESLKKPLPVHLRINSLKIEPKDLIQRLKAKGIALERVSKACETIFLAPGLPFPGHLLEYFLGQIHPQALTSCLASLALAPEAGSLALDLCAAPGGKTSHLCQIMNNTGLIIANELYPSRHIALGHTLSRLGVLNTVVTSYQAQEFPLNKRFDYVLADVPCSGEGGFRLTEGRLRPRDDKGEQRLRELQRKIILRGYDLLGPNGKMVYATCTYNPKENESIVDFLLRNRDAVLLPPDLGKLAIKYESGISAWERETYHDQVRQSIRFYPHQLDSVGFFLAKIGRRS